MRLLLAFTALLTAGVAAGHARTASFYAERGFWTVSTAWGDKCRAWNRPAGEFNFAPYNALQLVARANGSLGLEAYFWPGAFEQGAEYRLTLSFDNAASMSFPAAASLFDYQVAVEPAEYPQLWRRLQTAKVLRVQAGGAPELRFEVPDASWLLTALQNCAAMLAEP